MRKAAGRGLTVARLRWHLEKIGPLEEVTARLPASGAEYQITRPTDVDALLDMAQHDPEENLPYWAALWPSGVALADAVLASPQIVSNKRVLELGAGLGVTAIAALSAGADLTITDYAPESLDLARYNAVVNGQVDPNTLQVNWRNPSRDLRRISDVGFPVVLAADVLYEQRDVEPLLELVDWLVAPSGLLWLAEPRRYAAARFVELAGNRGWSGTVDEYDGPWPELNDSGVIVRVHKLRRS
jgi:predicted nicotinamide N-methyase